jgi:hypothetical protein
LAALRRTRYNDAIADLDAFDQRTDFFHNPHPRVVGNLRPREVVCAKHLADDGVTDA